MRNVYVLFALVTGLLLAQPVGANQRFQQYTLYYHAMQTGPGQILLVGDSRIEGFFHNFLAGHAAINAGASGYGIPEMRLYLHDLLVQTRPAVVIVMLGLSDAVKWRFQGMGEKELQDWGASYAEFLDYIIASGATPVPVTILPVARPRATEQIIQVHNIRMAIPAMNERIIRIAIKRGVPWVDEYASFVDAEGFMPESLAFGILHLNDAGYARLLPILDKAAALGYEQRSLQGR